MQRTGSFQIVQFLAVSKRQSREPFQRLADRKILSFNKTCRDVTAIRASVAYPYYCLYHRSRRVASSCIVLTMISEYLYDLGEVRLSSENILYALAVESESIRSQLESVFVSDTIPQRVQESVGGFASPLADCVGRNQFRVRIHRDENPCIAEFGRILGFHMALLLSTKSPNLIALNPLATKVAKLRIHQLFAFRTRPTTPSVLLSVCL